ncbi:uncharacterized protein AAES06_016017 isoform 1-T1 [Glossophaga mutica]
MLALSSLTTLLPHFCLSPPHRYRELSGNRRDFSGCGLHCLYPNKSRSQAMAGKERLPVFTQTSWPTEGHKAAQTITAYLPAALSQSFLLGVAVSRGWLGRKVRARASEGGDWLPVSPQGLSPGRPRREEQKQKLTLSEHSLCARSL